MEKYCTIAIFVWLGLPLFARGLIILESDASLNAESKEGISTVFENSYYSSENTISATGLESIQSGSLNIGGESNDKDEEIVTPEFENQDANHDFTLSSEISADGHESIQSRSLNIGGESNDKNEEIVSSKPENQDANHDHTSPSQIIAGGHESIKSGHLNIDGESKDKDDDVVSPGVENQDANHDHTSPSQISAGGHESTKIVSLNIGENPNDEDETTLSDFENSNNYRDYPLENLIDGGGHEMVESDPVTEKLPEGIELVYQMNKKRHAPERGFTEETKKLMLDLHNVYRGNVTPPAGDMNLLEWDDSLEHLAQLWADNCVFAHGRPASTKYEFEGKVYPYGQNLYIGTDPSGYKSLWMWYEEYMHYDLRNQTCKPFEQCGHYVQMAWAESKRLGCGIRLCGMRYLIVCHYYPGAIKGSQMFQVGRPCSLCNEEDGALCKDKLCVSHELCKRRPDICESAECNLRCQNCGRLNKTSCTCTCADGWDSPDCSKLCEDEHVRCGMKPGFPSKAACSINHYAVAKKYCRKMCDTCASVTTDSTVNHLCCEGRPCEKGYVLDLETKACRCTLLCPGPLCDVTDDESSALNYNFFYLISQILVIYFMNYINHSL